MGIARRFLQEELADPGFEFSGNFMMMPYQCEHPTETVYAGNYLEVPCVTGEGTKIIFCDVNGWNPSMTRGECLDDEEWTPSRVNQTTPGDLSMWIIIAAFLVVLTCGLLFLKHMVPKKKRRRRRRKKLK